MPSINQVISALAVAGLSVAAPTTPKQAFSLPRVVYDEGFKPHGQQEVLRTYQKFKAQPPSNVVAAAAAVTGSVAASPGDGYDSLYLCKVTAGSKTLNLDFDTGSSDLWVFSDKLPAATRSGHNYYTTSSTKQLKGYTWNISYGDGSGASGLVYRDTVTIGGVSYASQAVEAATSLSSSFATGPGDGLVGLAFDSINTVQPVQQKTFFSNVAPSLASPIIVANLKYHATGSYDFGYTDSSKYTGSISYTNVDNSQGFWGISYSGYGVGTSTLKSYSGNAIADTGTTLIYVPDTIVSAYYAKVSGAKNSNTYGGYVFPCSATLPDFYIKVGGFTSRVPGKYINYAPVTTGSSTCFGGIQSSNGVGIDILGDVFLKANYVVFDLSVPRLGLAAKTLN